MTIEPRRRRSGAHLEAALLDAAWDELVSTGYARLTMASVAARAGTSEPVLYRRWENKDRLVVAAFEHRRETHPVVVTDTGTLRGDLVDELTAVGEARAGFFAIASAAAFAGLRSADGSDPARVREEIMQGRPHHDIRPLYRRAAERGELDLDRTPRAVLEMPFELVRHDLLMNLGPPGADRIRSIVDDLFLPLVRRVGSAG